MRLSRRPSAAVRALAGAMCAEIGAVPSSRCSHSRWPPSSTIAIVTLQPWATASASAAPAIRFTSERVRKGRVFMGVVVSGGSGIRPQLYAGTPARSALVRLRRRNRHDHWGLAVRPGQGTRMRRNRSDLRSFQLGVRMNQPLQTAFTGYAGEVTSVEQRNRVLRNTYWLLALSMVPTVLGAWIGVATGITNVIGHGMSAIVFLGGAFAFMFAIEKTKNSAAGVPVLLALTFFMGLMLSRMIGAVLGLNNGAGLIMTAFAGTGALFLGLATLSTVIKRDLSAMGKFLFIGM